MKSSSASSTAFSVAQGIMLAAQKSHFGPYVPSDMLTTTELLLSQSDEGRKKLKHVMGWQKSCLSVMERLLLPNISFHYVLRKRMIERLVIESIQERGVVQVVNLGAGFDTLAMRLSRKFSTCQFFEIDHPATLKVKKNSISALPEIANQVCYIPVDFSENTLSNALVSEKQFSQDKRTLFIIEGVFMYLEKNEVVATLSAIKKSVLDKVECIFTYVLPDLTISAGPLLRLYLAILSEPLKWTATTEQIISFVKDQNFHYIQSFGDSDFRRLFLNDNKSVPLYAGELVAHIVGS